MTIVSREEQILRVRSQGIHPALNEKLSETLRTTVISAVKTLIEGSLQAGVSAFLAQFERARLQRSGFYTRGLNTQYGAIPDLQVPKLRQRNSEREWQILERYQRSLGNLMDWLCCLYVMGLSLRDRQEALYLLLGRVLSVRAVNQIVMAIWADGRHELRHYDVAVSESEQTWTTLFQNLINRGFDPAQLKLVSSDGSLGIPSALGTCFPQAQQPRCITHKVRGIERQFNFFSQIGCLHCIYQLHNVLKP